MKSRILSKLMLAAAVAVIATTPMQAKAQTVTEYNSETDTFISNEIDVIEENGEGEDLQKIDAPAKVWIEGDMARFYFKKSTYGTGFYSVKLFREGETAPVYQSSWSMGDSETDTHSGSINGGETQKFTTGRYYFEVYAEANDTEGWTDSDVTRSDIIEYVRPEAQLPAPTGIKLSGSQLMAYLPEISEGKYAGYYMQKERYNEDRQEYYNCGGSWNRPQFHEGSYRKDGVWTYDVEEFLKDPGKYRVHIVALSNDINTICDSDYSEYVYFDTTGISIQIMDNLGEMLSDSSKSADDIKDALSNENEANIEALLNIDDGLKKFQEAEDRYKAEKGIEVNSSVSDEVRNKFAGDPVIDGAAFNAGNGVKNVTLSIDKGTMETNYDKNRYQNAVQVKMTLEGASNTGKLDVPVKIKMPIPEGVSMRNLVILHYHNDGTMEVISPQIKGQYAEFVLTSFSDFVFANDTEEGEVASNNTSPKKYKLAASADDGNWYLYENDQISNYSGLYGDSIYGWWLVLDGRVAFEYDDLYGDANFGWWKITGGMVDFNYTGLYGSVNYGWWLVYGGQVAFDYSDLWGDANYGWWKITNGMVDFGYTGLFGSQYYGWWLIGGGQIAFDYTDLWGDVNYGWWKVVGGTIDFDYTGDYDSPAYGTCSIANGAVVF